MSLLVELDYPARPRHAVFSPCRTYRYALSRVWAADKPYALFIGLNPSTADETLDDPTIRRCIDFAKRWGYGGLVMANLFAYRATDPAVMKRAAEPVRRAHLLQQRRRQEVAPQQALQQQLGRRQNQQHHQQRRRRVGFPPRARHLPSPSV